MSLSFVVVELGEMKPTTEEITEVGPLRHALPPNSKQDNAQHFNSRGYIISIHLYAPALC